MNKRTDGFEPGDDKKVVEILKKWQGGVISDALFTQLAWMLPQPTIETVILRENNAQIEVLLTRRPEDDPVWPGARHSPGQVLRHMDYKRPDNTPLNGPFERVQEHEIKTKFLHDPEFVGVAQYMTKRGPEAVHVFLAAIDPKATLPEGAIWHPVDQLEKLDNFMQHQIIPISLAAKHFKERD